MRRYRVKLVDTGESSTSDKSYKAPNGKYYSSEASYKRIKEENSYRFQSIDYLSELLGYDDNIPVPALLFKKIEELRKCGYKVVYKTIEQQEPNIKKVLSKKEFKNESAKINYIMAILKNHIIDVYMDEKKKQESKIVQMRDYLRPDNPSEDNISNLRGQSGKGRDVSRFLGDDI